MTDVARSASAGEALRNSLTLRLVADEVKQYERPSRPRGKRRQPEIALADLVELGDVAGQPLNGYKGVVTLPIPAEVGQRNLGPGPKLALGYLLLRMRVHGEVDRSLLQIAEVLGASPATVSEWIHAVDEIEVEHPPGQIENHKPNVYHVPEAWLERAPTDIHVPLYLARLLGPRDAMVLGSVYTAAGELGICWTDQTALGERIGLRNDAVSRSIIRAEEARLIGREKRRERGGMPLRMWLLMPRLMSTKEIRHDVDIRWHVFEPARLNVRQGSQFCPQPSQFCPQGSQFCKTQDIPLEEPGNEPPTVCTEGHVAAATQPSDMRQAQVAERERGSARLRSVRELAPLLGLKLGKGSTPGGGVQCPSCRSPRRSMSRKGESRMSANIVSDVRGEGVKCHVPSCGWSGGLLDFVAMAMVGRRWPALRDDERRQVLGMARHDSTQAVALAPALTRGGQTIASDVAPEPQSAAGAGWHPPQEVEALWDDCEALMTDPHIVADLSGRGLDVERLDALGLARRMPDSARRPSWASGWLPTKAQHGQTGARARRLLTGLYCSNGERRGLTARSSVDKSRMRGSGSTTGLVMASPLAQRLLRGERVAVDRVVVAEGESDFFACALAVDDSAAVFGVGSGMWTQAHADRIPDGVLVVVATDTGKTGDRYASEVMASLEGRRVRLERWRPPQGCSDVMEVVEEGMELDLRGYCTNPREGEPLGIQCPSQDCSGELVRRKNKVDVMAGDVQTRTLVGCTSWRSRREPGCGTMMSLEAVDRELRAGEEADHMALSMAEYYEVFWVRSRTQLLAKSPLKTAEGEGDPDLLAEALAAMTAHEREVYLRCWRSRDVDMAPFERALQSAKKLDHEGAREAIRLRRIAERKARRLKEAKLTAQKLTSFVETAKQEHALAKEARDKLEAEIKELRPRRRR